MRARSGWIEKHACYQPSSVGACCRAFPPSSKDAEGPCDWPPGIARAVALGALRIGEELGDVYHRL